MQNKCAQNFIVIHQKADSAYFNA